MTGVQNRKLLLFILALTIISAFVTFTNRVWKLGALNLDTRPHYGLDIQGGLRVILHPDVDLYNKQHPKNPWGPNQLTLVKHIINNRVNFFGVSEPLIITRPSTNQIVVELPGVRNKQQAIEQLQATANLQFFLLPQLGDEKGTRPAIWSQHSVKDPKTGKTQDVLFDNSTNQPVTPEMLKEQVFDNSDLLVTTGADLLPNSEARLDPTNNQPLITFQFNDKGSKAFEEATRVNQGRFLGIFLDNQLLTAPVIQSVISGSGQITGISSLTRAKYLADQLNAGALPVPLQLQETRTLEATLGQEAVKITTVAGVVGLALVLVFMLAWYRLPGALADVALILYAIFTIALFKVIPVTLTLPGIAGFILSIGMAVDANILIFERMREELRSGKPLRVAIDTGFKRAFTAIFDSNICTMITCLVLYNFGTGSVRGFAFTLGLGVAVSMFTAIVVTRTLLFTLVNLNIKIAQDPRYYSLHSRLQDRLDRQSLRVMHYKALWIALSLLVIVPGAVMMGMGGIKRGIDFQGGTEMTLSFKHRHPATELNKILSRTGYPDSRVVLSDEPTAALDKHLADITTRTLNDTQRISLLNALTNNGLDLVQSQTVANVPYANVSGVISAQITLDAIYAVILASILIVAWLAIRFSIGGIGEGLKYGTCAVIALLHDVLVVLGSFAILGYFFNWQIDSLFVTAMLTVIGFSVHDTIIVFDRIRENLQHRARGETFTSITEKSIDQTISRSIKTSFTVVLVLLALFFFGSSVVHQFTAALLIGIISGTYSSIFNASVIMVAWKVWQKQDDLQGPISSSPSTSVNSRSTLTVPGDRPLFVPPAPQEMLPAGGAPMKPADSDESQKRSEPRKRAVRRRRM